MKTSSCQILQDKIGPNTLGLIWITGKNLGERPKFFNELDYFLDGLLNITVRGKEEEELKKTSAKNLFMTEHFGHTFFVCHLMEDGIDLSKSVKEIEELIDSPNHHKMEILVLNSTKHKYCEKLQEQLKSFKVQPVEID